VAGAKKQAIPSSRKYIPASIRITNANVI